MSGFQQNMLDLCDKIGSSVSNIFYQFQYFNLFNPRGGGQGEVDKNTPKKWENKPKIIIF